MLLVLCDHHPKTEEVRQKDWEWMCEQSLTFQVHLAATLH